MRGLGEHHRAITDELHRHGIRAEIERTNGGHVRIKWKVGDHPQSLTTASTPSDHRATKNEIAKVRRLLRVAGVTTASTPLVPMPAPSLEERIARLECDMQTVLDILTNPVHPRPAMAAEPVEVEVEVEPTPDKRQSNGRRADMSWLWRVLRYDVFLSVQTVVAETGQSYSRVACALSTWKARGYVEHERGKGWRKHRKVEELDKPNGNGRAN